MRQSSPLRPGGTVMICGYVIYAAPQLGKIFAGRIETTGPGGGAVAKKGISGPRLGQPGTIVTSPSVFEEPGMLPRAARKTAARRGSPPLSRCPARPAALRPSLAA